MKKLTNAAWLSAILAAALLLGGCSGETTPPEATDAAQTDAPGTTSDTLPAEAQTETQTETDAPAPLTIRPLTPAEGAVVSLLNDEMTEWLSPYRKEQTAAHLTFEEKCEPVPLKLSWEADGEVLYCHVALSRYPDMRDADTWLTVGTELEVPDLFAGTTYYWQVTATMADRTVRSAVFTFTTMHGPRTMAVEGISNMRDVGGAVTSDGRRVKQGLVYRSADTAFVTEAGRRYAVDELGIRTELDLRAETTGESPLGPEVRLVGVNMVQYSNVFRAENYAVVAQTMRLFADEANYPILFHCSLGRDRTGTVALLLGMLLGVPEEDLYMAYETSFFSDYSGYVDTTDPVSIVQHEFTDTLKGVRSAVHARDYTSAAELFLLKVGLTQEEIDSIRSILLEDAVSGEVN